jgi:hypothetical protein
MKIGDAGLRREIMRASLSDMDVLLTGAMLAVMARGFKWL